MEFLVARTVALLGLAMIVAIFARRLRLPYTVGLVLTGLGLAFARVDVGLELTHDVIFDLILPPLLFEAALNLSWRELRRELPPVIAISFVRRRPLRRRRRGFGLVEGLAWPLGAGARLRRADRGDRSDRRHRDVARDGRQGTSRPDHRERSLINDGVAALLFALVAGGHRQGGRADFAGEVLAEFALIAAGGVACGLIVGAAAIFVAGRTDEHLVETALTAVAAYGSFLIADHFGASGVLATASRRAC